MLKLTKEIVFVNKGKTKKTTVTEKEINSALIKKALGYDAQEIVEEYAEKDDGEIRLLKKKVTTKNVPPDITALKILIEGHEKQVSDMTDEELNDEKTRLLNLLNELNKGQKQN
jgi:hypothetical protein